MECTARVGGALQILSLLTEKLAAILQRTQIKGDEEDFVT